MTDAELNQRVEVNVGQITKSCLNYELHYWNSLSDDLRNKVDIGIRRKIAKNIRVITIGKKLSYYDWVIRMAEAGNNL
jgi:hypothetical protein